MDIKNRSVKLNVVEEPEGGDSFEPSDLRSDSYGLKRSGKSRLAKWLGILVAVVVLLWVYLYSGITPVGLLPRFTNNYQAVFLLNGQVYFGKLYYEGNRFGVLRDVYYLQVTQPPQPIQPGAAPATNINLVKLGNELHGPQDEMRINRDQILFIEDLKPDSRVVGAIEQLRSK